MYMKRTDDMFFWYNNPPYLRYWAKFTSEAAQLDEKEKAEKNSLPEHRRKLNEWKFMGARGRIYSEFKGGVKKPYNYQAKFLTLDFIQVTMVYHTIPIRYI